METKFVTSAYVKTENGRDYVLEYYITTQVHNGKTVYGVKVHEQCEDKCTTVDKLLFSDLDQSMKIIELFAQNFVFPSTMDDVIKDMAASF